MISLLRTVFVMLLAALPVQAGSAESIAVLERSDLALERGTAPASHEITLVLAYFEGAWAPEEIHAAARQGARILGQCGVAVARAELVLIDAPARYREFHTPVSRELARALSLKKPTIYFVAGTRQQPAFDAEAIGRGNSGSRPELRDTVWVARGSRDLGILLAHELAHVLMDSGEHTAEPGNLMREDTAPHNTTLSAAQCAQLRETATSNGLLQPVR